MREPLLIGLLVASVALFACLLTYARAGFWRRKPEGWILFFFVLASFVVSVLAAIIVGAPPEFERVGLIIVAISFYVVNKIVLSIALIYTQIKGQYNERSSKR